MPLFMDFHQLENVTVEEVKKAHMADLAIQERYGVRYLQYWVNPKAGTVFCLTEGPDKETCELVHKLAHGNIACALTEVEPGFYRSVMGEDHQLDHGHVKTHTGAEDLGYRTVLVISLLGKLIGSSPTPYSTIGVPRTTHDFVSEKISDFAGREVPSLFHEGIVGVFDDVNHALLCAIHLQEQLSDSGHGLLFFRMGLASSQPVRSDGDFFMHTIRTAFQLSKAASGNQIVVSALSRKLCQSDFGSASSVIRYVDMPTEEFITTLIANIEASHYDHDLTIPGLSHQMGFSQPQFYRKVVSVTGRAPNDFLRDLRLERGLSLLRDKVGNVSQVAMEVGYSNPSYFARCFARKFGCTPSLV